ncbi:MAG: hypothetical protein Q9159_001978 [Coniocarpon cinnabarinum]
MRNKRRSLSTTSRDTTAANSPTEQIPLQYAPIESHPYPQQAEQAPMVAPTDPQLTNEHAQLAQIRQFNNSYPEYQDGRAQTAENDALGDTTQSQTGQGPHQQPNGQQSSTHASQATQNAPQQRSLQRTMSLSLDGAGGTGTDEEKRNRKVANNNAANEKELRELIELNADRTLESIARDVRSAERTQKAEKAKQLFAMRWLKQYCRRGPESVPRARVYTFYAQRCGNDRVDTLNPASFGKLVRIIFPGIQTRRLGVRGESKYHYVNLALADDYQMGSTRPGSAHVSPGSERATPVDPEMSFRASMPAPADTASFPQHEQSLQQPPITTTSNPASQGYLFAEPVNTEYGSSFNNRPMYKQKLCFSHHGDQSPANDALNFQVPDITKFVPPGFDKEQSLGLYELYRAHCTSVVDAVRYVKEKQFFKLIGSFNGTMTVPVSKLFQQPSIADWIKECDRVMYQQIIQFVSQLVLQVLPEPVYLMLRNIGNGLISHIKKYFCQYPEHVVQAKLEVATVFCSLLKRLLRVNETAHAAANLLMKDEMRAIMWADWVNSVGARRVVETSLPRCGHEEGIHILTSEMRLLLAPLPPNVEIPEPPEFAEAAANFNMDGIHWPDYATADNIMERWSAFLKRLPSRFPDVPTRTLLYCLESVGCAALRDVTVNVAQSFGAWWTTKVWMDEMMYWLAEMGGFLSDNTSTPADPSPASQTQTTFEDHGNLEAVLSTSLAGVPQDPSRPATSTELPRPNSAHPNLEFGTMTGFSPPLTGQRHSSGPPGLTCESFAPCYEFSRPSGDGRLMADAEVVFAGTPRGGGFKSVGGEEFEDSGIGMGLLEGSTGLTPLKMGAT